MRQQYAACTLHRAECLLYSFRRWAVDSTAAHKDYKKGIEYLSFA